MIDIKAKMTTRIPKNKIHIQPVSPVALILKDTEIMLKPLNNNQKPIKSENRTNVSPGYLSSTKPIKISKIPPARYRPKLSISCLLLKAKKTLKIPLTKMRALKKVASPIKLSTGVENIQYALISSKTPIIKKTHQFLMVPETFEIRFDMLKILRFINV